MKFHVDLRNLAFSKNKLKKGAEYSVGSQEILLEVQRNTNLNKIMHIVAVCYLRLCKS